MMKFLTAATCFVLSMYIASAEASTCYSMAEMEAEQGLRIHSELMVISLNCQHMSHDRGNLYILYREFTRKHKDLIANYERSMMSYFTRAGYRSPENALHSLRTDLANKVAEDAANMRPDLFCRAYSNRIPDALQLTRAQVKGWAAKVHPGMSLTKPICANADKKYNKG